MASHEAAAAAAALAAGPTGAAAGAGAAGAAGAAGSEVAKHWVGGDPGAPGAHASLAVHGLTNGYKALWVGGMIAAIVSCLSAAIGNVLKYLVKKNHDRKSRGRDGGDSGRCSPLLYVRRAHAHGTARHVLRRHLEVVAATCSSVPRGTP